MTGSMRPVSDRRPGAGGARSAEREHVARSGRREGASAGPVPGVLWWARELCWLPWLAAFLAVTCWLLVQVARGFGL